MGLRIDLEADGQPLPLAVSQLEDGVVLAGEEEAPPRRTTLEILPVDAEAEFGLRTAGGVIPLAVVFDAGGLLVESTPPSRLRGRYSIRLHIDDLAVVRGRWKTVTLDQQGNGAVRLSTVVRQIRLTRPVSAFDDAIRAVVTASRVDGAGAEGWLVDPLRQAKRKACLLNLLAVLRSVVLGDGRPAVVHLSELLQVSTDHLDARAAAALYWLVSEEARRPEGAAKLKVFADFGVHASHRKALQDLAARLGEPLVSFESFRFAGKPSLQIVFGIPAAVATSHLVDIDLDLGNPRQDVLGLVIHFGELFDEGLDHLKLRDRLARGPAEPFLYYEPA